MLYSFLKRHVPANRLAGIWEVETRPMTPYRFAHYVAHYEGAPNPK